MPQQMNFVADAEPWCQYTLEDGTTLRIRVMLVKVILDGVAPDGTPNYQLKMQQVTDCEPSDLARRTAKEMADKK